MFYNALVRFRDEQLENYEGQPLEYSASDYHHISRSPRGINRRNSSRRHSNTIRRRSHFSIRSDRDARRDSKGATLYGTAEPPSTNQATDLGRKKSMVEAVKILRAPSSDSFEEVESPEKSAFEILPNKKTRVNSVKSFQSRASRSKSRTGINSTSAPRAASYKRNVSFRHVRNRSQGATSEKSKTKAQNADLKKLTSQSSLRSNATRLDMERSPSLPAPPVMVRNSLGIKKVRDSDMAWNDETRKVSHELSLICEEAFNTSIVSTARTSSTRESGETAATSVTMASRENSHHLLAPEKPKAAQRDAPAAASTCRSYTATELAETRRKLIEHSTKDGTEKVPAYLAGVIAHLDRLIEQDKQRKLPKPEDLNDQFWTLPDSFVKPSNDPGYLPVINEELLTPFGSGKNVTSKSEVPKTSARNFARNSAHTPAARRSQDAKPTIRMVSHSSLGSIEEIKPLNVRKKTDTTHSASGLQLPEGQEAKSDTITRDSPRIKFTSSGSRESHPGGVGPIEERPKTPTRGGTGLEKKWSLFRHKSQIQTQAQEPAKPVPVPPVDDTKAKGAGAKGFFSKLIKRKQKDHDKPEGK